MGRFALIGMAGFLGLGLSPAAAQQDRTELQVVVGDSSAASEVDAPVPHACVRFDPDSVYVAGDVQGYGLADGDRWIKEVNGSWAEARLAVYIIRYYGMNEFCRVGGRENVLTYFLVNGDAPRGRSPSEDCVWFDQTGS